MEGWSLFGMPNGSIIDLFAPEAASGMCPWGLNDGLVFGFRVDDIQEASQELEAGGCELLGYVNFIEQLNYSWRQFAGPTAMCTASTSSTDHRAGRARPGRNAKQCRSALAASAERVRPSKRVRRSFCGPGTLDGRRLRRHLQNLLGAAQSEMNTWTAEQAATFPEPWHQTGSVRHFSSACTALRRGEVLGLRWRCRS
jgi:hypothetical protein